jgi:hypothetical protein
MQYQGCTNSIKQYHACLQRALFALAYKVLGMNIISTDTVPSTVWVYWLHMDMTTFTRKCIPGKGPMRGEKSAWPEKQFVWPNSHRRRFHSPKSRRGTG